MEVMQTDRQDYDDQSGDEEEDEAVQRLNRICDCANKILAKYTSNGMIKYSDSPQFHNLVENWDYRMICILEVYTQNRNEDDFLENLGILGELLREQNNSDNEFDSEINRNESDFNQSVDLFPA
jgi:hypothetical protein